MAKPFVKVELKGLKEQLKKFLNAPEVIQREANTSIARMLAIIEGASKPLTPIDTGRLRSSYRTRFRPLAGHLIVNTNYAIFVHEGTRFMERRPFLQDGVTDSQDRIKTEIRALGALINKDLAVNPKISI
ncbi:MAG: hypothetical protein KAS32_21200 [Candidatus Peribacteraceae bacterium]|nr:hypothetical protein [Candidatus Peribacteraceae bacterium]